MYLLVTHLKPSVKRVTNNRMERSETPKRTATISMSEETRAIVVAWQAYFDKERPGTKASVSEVLRALVTRVGMPPSRPMPRGRP